MFKSLLTTIALALLVTFVCPAQEVSLIPYRMGKKWGYLNTRDSLIVPAKYQLTGPIIWGRGLVKKKGRYGYVNKQGKIVLPIIYTKAGDFEEAFIARVCMDTGCLYIDTDGNKTRGAVVTDRGANGAWIYVFTCKSTGLKGAAQPDLNGGSEVLIEPNYRNMIPIGSGHYFIVQDTLGRYGMIDIKEAVVVPFEYDEMKYDDFLFVIYTRKGDLHGALNVHGRLIAYPRYDRVQYYHGVVKVWREGKVLGYVYNGKEYWKD